MEKLQIETILKNHLPENSLEAIVDLIVENKVHLNITKSRSSKYGDFKVSGSNKQPQLSINYNLNPYSFLITLLHEIAHLLVWRNHHSIYRRIKPHGKEWKSEFKTLMEPFLYRGVFPEPLLSILKKHMLNPKASSSSDISLMKELRKFDQTYAHLKLLSDLQIGDLFHFKNSAFKIIRKNRTRYLCENINNKKRYLVHSLVEVEMLN